MNDSNLQHANILLRYSRKLKKILLLDGKCMYQIKGNTKLELPLREKANAVLGNNISLKFSHRVTISI